MTLPRGLVAMLSAFVYFHNNQDCYGGFESCNAAFITPVKIFYLEAHLEIDCIEAHSPPLAGNPTKSHLRH